MAVWDDAEERWGIASLSDRPATPWRLKGLLGRWRRQSTLETRPVQGPAQAGQSEAGIYALDNAPGPEMVSFRSGETCGRTGAWATFLCWSLTGSVSSSLKRRPP